MQILRDVYKLTGEEYRMVPNIYALRANNELILVDCGTDDESDWKTARETLRYWGLDNLKIAYVLITHAHFDHAGYAAELQKRGAKIVAGCHAVALEKADDLRNLYFLFHKPFPAVIPDRYVSDGEILNLNGLRFEVAELPGHSCGDVVYTVEMNGKRIMFLGDVFHIKEYGAGPWIGDEWFPDSDYKSYLRSLYRMKDMKADVLLSGHMRGCLKGATGILQEAFGVALERFDGRWDKEEFMKELEEKKQTEQEARKEGIA